MLNRLLRAIWLLGNDFPGGKILNVSRKVALADQHKLLRSTWSHGIGLMWAPKLEGQGLVFDFNKKVPAILHNLFVFQSIDVLWLVKGEVVALRHEFRPFSLHAAPDQPSDCVVELPSGTLKATKTSVGDKVRFL